MSESGEEFDAEYWPSSRIRQLSPEEIVRRAMVEYPKMLRILTAIRDAGYMVPSRDMQEIHDIVCAAEGGDAHART